MVESDVIVSLTALAHPMRLRVFRALVVAGPSGLTPGALQERLSAPATTLSFHLKELASSRLVTCERASRNLIYRAAFDRTRLLLGFLTAHCCEGELCAVSSESICAG